MSGKPNLVSDGIIVGNKKNPTRAGQLAFFLQKDSYINIFYTNNFFSLFMQ